MCFAAAFFWKKVNILKTFAPSFQAFNEYEAAFSVSWRI